MNAPGLLARLQKNGDTVGTLVLNALRPSAAGNDADGIPAALAKLLVGMKLPRVVKLKLPSADGTNCPVSGLTEPRVVNTKSPTVDGTKVPRDGTNTPLDDRLNAPLVDGMNAPV